MVFTVIMISTMTKKRLPSTPKNMFIWIVLFKCGHGYSCLKITKPPDVFNMYGEFVPPDRRREDITLFRGCFVLDVHEVMEVAFEVQNSFFFTGCLSCVFLWSQVLLVLLERPL